MNDKESLYQAKIITNKRRGDIQRKIFLRKIDY